MCVGVCAFVRCACVLACACLFMFNANNLFCFFFLSLAGGKVNVTICADRATLDVYRESW